jgi:hypothetical protein
VGGAVWKYQSQELKLQFPNRDGIGGAQEEAACIFDEVAGTGDANRGDVVEGDLLDVGRATEESDKGTNGELGVFGGASVDVASSDSYHDAGVSAL